MATAGINVSTVRGRKRHCHGVDGVRCGYRGAFRSMTLPNPISPRSAPSEPTGELTALSQDPELTYIVRRRYFGSYESVK